ncbi:hypothetical protein KA093_00340 [Candidatus Saccharibacteria bacterium]|nr:hypothetical protein [Candidatus Saccharibacteria bacterium]
MEPILPSPHGFPEVGPIMPRAPEVAKPHAPEHASTIERPAAEEQKTGGGAGDIPPPMPVVPLPAAPVSNASQHATTMHDDTNPVVAADEDLIEKEWVEKAKKVISETKHDPYAQEQAVSRLQADYLNKRYGKVIKLPRED